MNRFVHALFAVGLLSGTIEAFAGVPLEETARPEGAAAADDPGVSIQTLLRSFAKKTGRKVVIDPRVHGNIELLGEEASAVTYGELLTILQVGGFTAVEGGGFLKVIPEAIVRQSALPLVTATTTYPDAQYVAAVIPVHKMPAAYLVPVLRPLLPQQAHLAAEICSNSILMVDTYANIRRIESLIAAVDTGDPYKAERCEASSAGKQLRDPPR